MAKKTIDNVTQIVLDTKKMNKQAIIFVMSKRSAQKTAQDIAHFLDDQNPLLQILADKLLHTLDTPTTQCQELATVVRKGVAFHHAGLAAAQKELIEEAFSATTLKFIVATPTLAAGMDLPAYRTILKEMKRFSAPYGMRYIPVLEYEQMAGRAGRPGKEDIGQAILIGTDEKEKEKLEQVYIYGTVEDIYSKLASEPILRSYVLSLLATGICQNQQDLEQFFSKTFWAHQYQDMFQLYRIIARVVDLLKSYGFLAIQTQHETQQTTQTQQTAQTQHETQQTHANNSLFTTALDLVGPLTVTPIGHRVSQLYIDPLTANHIIIALQQPLSEFGLIHMLACTLEMRPQLSIKAKETEDYELYLQTQSHTFMVALPSLYDPDYEDFFFSLKTTKFLIDWLHETTEDILFERYDIRPGEIKAKIDILDWLLYCAIELAKLLDKKDIAQTITHVRTRLEYGIKEELLGLVSLQGVGRVRARQLYNAGYISIRLIKEASLEGLSAVVGNALAIKIKKQVE